MEETPRAWDQKAVTAALRRGPGGAFTPQKPLRDPVVGGHLLVVGKRTASWQLSYTPHGRRADGRRHGRVQMTIGDAMTMSLPQARKEARALKAAIAKGEDPHRQRRAAKATKTLERVNAPTTLTEAAAAYAVDLSRRATPSLATRKQEAHYFSKAIALMGASIACPPTSAGAAPNSWPASARDERLAERGHPPLWSSVAVLRLDGRGAAHRGQSLPRHSA